MTKNKTFILIALIICSFTLSACGSTVEGIKEDWSIFNNNVTKKTEDVRDNLRQSEDQASVIIQNKLCPPVQIDPLMANFTEFEDPNKTTDAMKISQFKLIDSSTLCELDGKFVSMQIDLTFEGKIGPKNKRKDGSKVFFSYPYFVSVNDIEGNELAQEVFAASVSYDKGETTKKIVETIRQRLPLEDNIAPYQIEVGFSLTEEQIQYNANK